MQKEHHHGRNIGGQIGNLRAAGGFEKRIAQPHREGNGQEGAGSGADHAIVQANRDTNDERQNQRLPAGFRRFLYLSKIPDKNQHQRHQWKRCQHHHLQQLLPHIHRQRRAGCRAKQGADCRRNGTVPVDITRLHVLVGRQRRATAVGKFVGSCRQLNGHAGDQVCRQRNHAASSRDGIHKTRQKNQRAHNHKSPDIHIHG